MRQSSPLPFMLLLLLAAFVAGCGGADTIPSAVVRQPTATATVVLPAQVDVVHIVRTSDGPQRNLPAFDRTGHNAAAVQAFYAGLRALPPYLSSGTPCPTDRGVQYTLTFSYQGKTVLNAIADPTGCQIVILAGRDNRTAVKSQVWALLAAAVGVKPSIVYPLPA